MNDFIKLNFTHYLFLIINQTIYATDKIIHMK